MPELGACIKVLQDRKLKYELKEQSVVANIPHAVFGEWKLITNGEIINIVVDTKFFTRYPHINPTGVVCLYDEVVTFDYRNWLGILDIIERDLTDLTNLDEAQKEVEFKREVSDYFTQRFVGQLRTYHTKVPILDISYVSAPWMLNSERITPEPVFDLQLTYKEVLAMEPTLTYIKTMYGSQLSLKRNRTLESYIKSRKQGHILIISEGQGFGIQFDKNVITPFKVVEPRNETVYKYPKITILGCGSLGSYLASCLLKNGVLDLDLYDSDKLEVTNLPRHILSETELNENKAKALAKVLITKYKHATIRWSNDWEGQSISKDDIIIDATGSWNVARNIAKLSNKCKITVWVQNEGKVGGILLDNQRGPCMCCHRDSTGFMSINGLPKKRVRGSGCNNIYLPYSAAVAETIAAQTVNYVQQFLLNSKIGNLYKLLCFEEQIRSSVEKLQQTLSERDSKCFNCSAQ